MTFIVFFSQLMLTLYVNDIVASTFVHELVNMKVDHEYLSPLQATKVHCSLPARIEGHRRWCWSRVDVQFSTIVPWSICHRSPCGLRANGCEGQSLKTLDRHFRGEDMTPRTTMAYDRLVLLILNNPTQEVAEAVVQPVKIKYWVSFSIKFFKNSNFTSSCSVIANIARDEPDCGSVMLGLCLLLSASISVGLPRCESRFGLPGCAIPTVPMIKLN